METLNRKAFQGISNIIRFNWHFYALALIFITALLFATVLFPSFNSFFITVATLAFITTCTSLAVSYYVYDASGFYQLNWLRIKEDFNNVLVNIHAGFDETSVLLQQRFPSTTLIVFDFYDPTKHTEISIERARKAYPSYPDTERIQTSNIPLKEKSVSAIFCILSAHEIRDHGERVVFFHQLKNSLKEEGSIILVEHLRDLPNFLAYTIGFLHFHSADEWKKTFLEAGLTIIEQNKFTPFLTVYTLQKNGTAP